MAEVSLGDLDERGISRYEFIVAVSKEVRRINQKRRIEGVVDGTNPTTIAIKRVLEGKGEIVHKDRKE